jgi:hypothetical protein
MLVCVLVFSWHHVRPSSVEFNIQTGGFTVELMKLKLLGPFTVPFLGLGEALKEYARLSLI